MKPKNSVPETRNCEPIESHSNGARVEKNANAVVKKRSSIESMLNGWLSVDCGVGYPRAKLNVYWFDKK